jgi:hypothetical protein
VLFCHILLFMILQLDSVMESKRRCKSDREPKKAFDVMTRYDKTNITDTLRGRVRAAAAAASMTSR